MCLPNWSLMKVADKMKRKEKDTNKKTKGGSVFKGQDVTPYIHGVSKWVDYALTNIT